MAIRSTLTIALALMISTMTPTAANARYYNPDAADCHRLAKTAVEVGWPRRELPTLRRIAARESLCNNRAYNGKDPWGGSYCALQLNGSNRGYLTRQRIIAGDMEEELPGWKITVGPREAAHLPAFLKSK